MELKMMIRCALALVCVMPLVCDGFQQRKSTHLGRSRTNLSSSGGGDAILEAPGWEGVRKLLNELPVFCCANVQGQPLQYEMDGKPLAMFYACVDAAKAELALARKEYPELELDIVPFQLGEAFRLSRQGAGILVPSKESLIAAGAPRDASPVGQELPLFCCMEMAQEVDGTAMLPMFMDMASAKAAVAEASKAGGDDGDQLEIVGLSLNKAIEQLVSLDSPAFMFVPPASSLAHIQAYLDASGGAPVSSDDL